MKPYYEDDAVTIYHGDCREVTAWLEADVLVTDPPYGRSWRQGQIGDHAKNEASRTGIAHDSDSAVRDAALAMWGDRPAVVFGDLMLAPPAGTKLTCIYHKADPAAGLRGAIAGVRRDCEAIYLLGGWDSGLGGRSSLFRTSRRVTSATGVVARNGGHPHTKPDDVMGALIGLAPEGATIADPFMGSGSTLRAAKDHGRRAIGIELDERYCEIAAKRLGQEVLDFGGAA